jgi:hypothetical protein
MFLCNRHKFVLCLLTCLFSTPSAPIFVIQSFLSQKNAAFHIFSWFSFKTFILLPRNITFTDQTNSLNKPKIKHLYHIYVSYLLEYIIIIIIIKIIKQFIYYYYYKKAQFALKQAIKAQRGSKGIALLFL